VASLMRALQPRVAAAKTTTRRRPTAITSRWLGLPPPLLLLLQRRPGAEVREATNAPIKRLAVTTEARVAWCTIPRTTMWESVEKSRSSWSSSVRSSSNYAKKEEEVKFQKAKRDLKAVYGHSDSESSDNERRKTLHIIFRGSWDITSQCVIKTLCHMMAAVVPALRAAPHNKWLETVISFDATDYPKIMVGTGQLLLLVSPTIANIKLYHILIDGGAALNLISLTTFKKLQIPMSKLQPSRPFSGVGPVAIMSCGCISLPVTFGMLENFRTESVLFNVVEVNLSFNAILGRPTLYQFMDVAHYGYLVLKMSSPNGVLKVHGDCDAGVSMLEKL
jgi:hypothetical protein